MKRCELCKSLARIYCESDQASLCWDCDAKVHSANFLVARHSRNLLCHVCQSPTPWNASGEKLGATVSVCERCVDATSDERENDDEREEESDGDNDDEIDTDDEDEIDLEDEDGDNQVVPWSSTLPPPAASSSSNEESSRRFSNGVSLKRNRDKVADLSSEDDLDCSSSQRNRRTMIPVTAPSKIAGEADPAFVDSLPLRPPKARRSERFHQRDMISGECVSPPVPVVGICEATRAVGFDSGESS